MFLWVLNKYINRKESLKLKWTRWILWRVCYYQSSWFQGSVDKQISHNNEYYRMKRWIHGDAWSQVRIQGH